MRVVVRRGGATPRGARRGPLRATRSSSRVRSRPRVELAGSITPADRHARVTARAAVAEQPRDVRADHRRVARRGRAAPRARVDDRAVRAVDELVDADAAHERVDRPRAVGRRVVEDALGRRPRPRGPPRAPSRSACSGAPPASIAKTTRSRGCARAPERARTRATRRSCRRRSASSPATSRARRVGVGLTGASRATALGPGCDEQRRVAALEACRAARAQRCEAVGPGDARRPAARCRPRRRRAARRRRAGSGGRSDYARPTRRTARRARAGRRCGRSQQRLGLARAAGSRSPQRARDRDAARARRRRPRRSRGRARCGIVVARVERVVGLVAQAQDPAVAVAAQQTAARAAVQRGDERLRPERAGGCRLRQAGQRPTIIAS